MEKAKCLFWVALVLCSATTEASTTIKNIRYEGNKVTQDSVMNREIYIQEGDNLNIVLVDKSRQAIMDLGLFKSVHYYLENAVNASSEDASEVDVIFVVTEKYYLLVIPKAKVDDNELSLGVQLRWDNVWGLNHEMRVLAEDRGTTQGVQKDRNTFKYFYPNVFNSSYNIKVKVQSVNDVDESSGVVDRQDEVYQLGVSRWLNKRGRSRGWFVGGSIQYHQRNNDVISGPEPEGEVDAVVVGLDAGYKNVSTFEYNRGGKEYGYMLDWAHESVGSDTEYTRHRLYYRSYYRFDEYPLSNLNVQTLLGHSNNDILGDDAFSLGSSDDLRGYENDRFNGNSMFLTNMEYMFPHEAYPAIRYVYFVDLGNTYDRLSHIFHRPLNVGAGVGLRWKIKAFVKLDLRADIGYGLTDNDYRLSFGTRHAF